MKISIIVPVYNVEKYVERCIESILRQTVDCFELILVDDGSTDNSGFICDQYALKDERIVVIHQKNKGLAGARNSGMKVASGDYFLFCDSDDYVGHKWIESFLPYISPTRDNFIFGGHIVAFEGEHIKCKRETPKEYDVDEIVQLHTQSKAGFAWNVLYYADILITNNISFPSEVIIEDLPFVLNYISHMKRTNYTGNMEYYYMQKDVDTLSKKYYADGFRKWQEKYKSLTEFIDGRSSSSKDSLLSCVANYYIVLFLNSINNTFDNRNDMSLINKIRYNIRVVKSDEFQSCLHNANCAKENRIYINLLKRKKYLLALTFRTMADLKSRMVTIRYKEE